MKEIFDSGKKGFDAGSATLVEGFALWRGEKGGTVTTVLGRRFANGFGQGSQAVNSTTGAVSQQVGIIIARIQQQGLDSRRQVIQLGLQDMALASAAGH